jgi:hypothetical protein
VYANPDGLFDFVRLGTLPEWIAALGTVGALAFVAVGLHREREARQRDERDRDAAQARLIVAWPLDEIDPLPLGDIIYFAKLANYSQLPVRGITLTFQPGNLTKNISEQLPKQVSEHEFRVTGPTVPVPIGGRAMTLVFLDARGLRWRRTQDGDPERIVG